MSTKAEPLNFKRVFHNFPHKTTKLTLFFLLVTLIIHFSPRFFQAWVQFPIQFISLTESERIARIESLPPGNYFVSVGRPHGGCVLLLDGQILDSNQSIFPELRSHLLLGGGFAQGVSNHHKLLTINCSARSGMPTILFHEPVISKFIPGVILQLLRGMTIIFLGPLCSLALIFSLLFLGLKIKARLNVQASFLFFSLVTFLYTVSLSHFTSLIFTGIICTEIHIVLRFVFSFSFIVLCRTYSGRGKLTLITHLVLLFCLSIIILFRYDLIVPFYRWTFFVFPVVTAVAAFQLLSLPTLSPYLRGLGSLSAAWALLQLIDGIYFWLYIGPFLGPSMISVLAGYLAYFKYREILTLEQEAQLLAAELEVKNKLTRLTRLIAHDIRSPITLLQLVVNDSNLSKEMKDALHLSAVRLKGIADQTLSISHRLFSKESLSISQTFEPSLERSSQIQVSSSLRHALFEKEKTLRGDKLLQFKLQISSDLENLTVDVQPTEFDRLISNLLNNAAEAIQDLGVISIEVTAQGGYAVIQIQDTGSGIPAPILAKIGSPGLTHGKTNGNGLGLFHAKNTIEFWKGKFEVSSEEGKGTTVTISIPRITRSTPVKYPEGN